MKELLIYSKLIPLVTFIAGYLFSVIGQFWSSKRELKKIRRILGHEINNNMTMLLMAQEYFAEDNKNTLDMRLKVYARASESISSVVFDSYLSNLSKLTSNEIERILAFYTLIGELKRHSSEFILLINTSDRSESQSKQLVARGAAVDKVAKSIISSGRKLSSLTELH